MMVVAAIVQAEVTAYLGGLDPRHPPVGIERTVAFRTRTIALTGRVDRLDDRGGELVVVDYKTSRRASTTDEARTSLPMALYAAAVWKMFRRRCVRVELHHVPTGTVAAHTHTDESLTRKVAEDNTDWTPERLAARQVAMAKLATAIWRISQLS